MNPPLVSPLYLACLVGAQALLGGCGRAEREPAPPRPGIEVRGPRGVVARVVAGHPCRAKVEGIELLVGGRPLVAQHGATRWTGEDAPNGTTLKKDGVAAARVHARQIFDGEGLPILRVMDDGSIADRASAVVRRASVTEDRVEIGDVTVTGTTDVVLAAMLAAPEISPDLRALVACHFLLPGTP